MLVLLVLVLVLLERDSVLVLVLLKRDSIMFNAGRVLFGTAVIEYGVYGTSIGTCVTSSVGVWVLV